MVVVGFDQLFFQQLNDDIFMIFIFISIRIKGMVFNNVLLRKSLTFWLYHNEKKIQRKSLELNQRQYGYGCGGLATKYFRINILGLLIYRKNVSSSTFRKRVCIPQIFLSSLKPFKLLDRVREEDK